MPVELQLIPVIETAGQLTGNYSNSFHMINRTTSIFRVLLLHWDVHIAPY